MSPERWARVKEIFAAVRETDPKDRAVRLDTACGEDRELRAEVERMLAHDDDSLRSPAAALLGAARRFAPGDMVGPYRLEAELGQGGMGLVYRAFDTRLRRSVAFKMLAPEDLADPERKQRLLREARAASALNHPNIVTVHEVGCEGGVDFIAMEFIEGKTLDAVIPPKGLPVQKALDYAIQTAGGLAKAHAAGVVHRDLKPGNIMVTGPASGHPGQVKLVDFGLARQAPLGPREETTLTVEGAILGTPAYMSPEQAHGKATDARSDVFSFGVVLYEMLTGRRVFCGGSAAAVLAAVLREEPAPLEGKVPTELARIVRRCLRKDPDRRFQSMADLRVALQDVVEESQAQLAGGSLAVRGARRWLWVAIGALAVVVSAGWWLRKYLEPELPEPRLVRLTSYPSGAYGFVCCPSFSPDGKQVAFVWTGEKGDHADIYVKIVGETNAVRLTNGPAQASLPAWNPDGKRIAFRRVGPDGGIWTVSPLGGAEQKLADLNATGPMSWSADGKWLAAARLNSAESPGEGSGIFLAPSDGSEPRRITNPKPPAYDVSPSFSPEGRSLAYAACSSRWSCDVFVQEFDSSYAPKGNPRPITHQRFFIVGTAWSRDGGSLVYGAGEAWAGQSRLWRVDSSGKREPKRYDLAGLFVNQPSIAPAGDRLAFIRAVPDTQIRLYHTGEDPKPFLTSSARDDSPQFSPDGSKVAFSSTRSGDRNDIWVANADGTQPVQLTFGIGRAQSDPRWSPDGRLIAFDSQDENGRNSSYVVDAGGGRPKRINTGGDTGVASWSHDGKWIYFMSRRTGRPEIWRIPNEGGQARQITHNGGYHATESRDGKTLYISYQNTVFARQLADGSEQRLLDSAIEKLVCPVENGIYYIGSSGPDPGRRPLQFYDFATRSSRVLTYLEGAFGMWGLTVSPDRRTILYSGGIRPTNDLMMIENFR